MTVEKTETAGGKNRYRTIWISDVHLGMRGSKADQLLDFLQKNEAEYLYLVGDIVDGWRLKRSWHWPQSHNDLIQYILNMAGDGTRILYLPGNHDEAAREYLGLQFGGMTVVDEAIHQTADGRRLLIIHGDQFDAVVQYMRWLARIGDHAYMMLFTINGWFNFVRRKLGFSYWSLSAYLKHKAKSAVEYLGNYKTALADEARRRNLNGVVCGHIHHAEIREMGDILYCNDGDWVESCTALVEHADGRLEIVRWLDQPSQQPAQQSGDEPA